MSEITQGHMLFWLSLPIYVVLQRMAGPVPPHAISELDVRQAASVCSQLLPCRYTHQLTECAVCKRCKQLDSLHESSYRRNRGL